MSRAPTGDVEDTAAGEGAPDSPPTDSALTKTRASTGSNASKVSTKSTRSLMSKASTISASVKKGLGALNAFNRNSTATSSTMKTSASVAKLVNLDVGDTCEVLSTVTLRAEIELESEVVCDVPIGSTFTILEVGEGRRIKIQYKDVEGWISSKTKMNEPLVMKRGLEMEFVMDDFEVGGLHEIKSMVTVRAEELLDSEVLSELKPGTVVRIMEMGKNNERRARVKVEAEGVEIEGWISVATKAGDLLLGQVSSQKKKPSQRGFFSAGATKVKNMLEAARSGDATMLKTLCESKGGMMSKFAARPSLNATDIRGKTALIYACSVGNKEVVGYLLSRGRELDINAIDDTMKTALHHASKRSRVRREGESQSVQAEIVKALLEAGAVLEARDHNGCTPLMFACANGDEAVVNAFIEAKAEINAKDFEGHLPLDYATNFRQDAIIKILKDNGAESGGAAEEEAVEEAGQEADPTATATVEEAAGAAEEVVEEVAAEGGEASPEKKKKKKADAEEAPKPKKKAAAKKKAGADAEAEGDKKKGGKKVAGGKPKRRNSAQFTGAMLEAVAETTAVGKVECEVEAEQVSDKDRAITKLKAVIEDSTSINEIEAAIKTAKAAGAEEADCAEAEAKVKALKERVEARENLMACMEELDVGLLKEAIERATKAGVVEAEIKKAKDVLAKEEPKQQARDALKAAQVKGDIPALKTALERARKAGVAAGDLKEYEELIAGAENAEKAEANLRKAISDLDVDGLKAAIKIAQDAKVDAGLIKQAEETLKVEEPKHKARQEIDKAFGKATKEAYKAAIEVAKAAGLAATEYAELEDLLKKEAEKEKLVAELNAALEKTLSADLKDMDSVKENKDLLHAAIVKALEMGVSEDLVKPAEIRRKKLHNAAEDLKGSIRVFCRIRPLSKKEVNQGDTNETSQIDVQTVRVGDQEFMFDSVWTPGTQDEVFLDCQDLIQSAVDGYNVTMFAYGQTGAGKTFTMAGVRPDLLGVTPRTIVELFRVIEENKARFEFTVLGSMSELYRNDLIDLIGKKDADKAKLNIRQEKSGAVVVENLVEEECKDAVALEKLYDRGMERRTVAATAMNSESSRSHLVFMAKIISVNRETKEQLRGKILICDLAGSERLKKSQVTADMQKEAIEINKSLTALGDVIQALTQGSKMIPYRNHKLTQLMQDSLGGTAKTLMFVNCSPAASNLDETTMALKYAQRAKTITNKSAKK